MILINPDNPSGNYIPKKDLMDLVSWAEKREINLVVDESFADFADEQGNTLISSEILNGRQGLFVIKSISKSYGVPGLRLGVLASGNLEMIKTLKKDVAIWNINSFAEFYMQIEEKYKRDYIAALDRFREERERFVLKLQKIDGLNVFPSQANYLMAEITNGQSASELTRWLLLRHDILIKDLTAKMGQNGKQYVRLAIKTEKENQKLVEALAEELGSIRKNT